jgi:hypothetical protein
MMVRLSALRPSRRLVPLFLLAGMLLAACASRPPAPSSSSPGPLAGLDAPKTFRARRSSSADLNWQNGNGDARPIQPGETLTLSELDGPGRIVHIWSTVAGPPDYPRALVLRIYWDGAAEPAVEAPLGDFFASGMNLQREVNSLPVSVNSKGRAYNCWWPMPFHKSARITVTNDSRSPVIGFFWYVDWQKLKDLPADTPSFHAQYRQESPCRPGDYLILDAEGKGHYVGTVYSTMQREGNWIGEGDDRFYIDGETTPSLRGTGTEDYFGDAWGFFEFQRPFNGAVTVEGWAPGNITSVYRWHIADPIPFERSLKVTIEHKGPRISVDNQVLHTFSERFDNFSTVAFWYQTGRAKRFADIPPLAERFPKLLVADETQAHVLFALDQPGNTEGWTLEGKAFGVSSVCHTTASATLNSLGRAGETAMGRAISPPFVLHRELIAFRLQGGGSTAVTGPGELSVRLLDAETNEILLAFAPQSDPHLREELVDIRNYRGRKLKLEVVDANPASTNAWVGIQHVRELDEKKR